MPPAPPPRRTSPPSPRRAGRSAWRAWRLALGASAFLIAAPTSARASPPDPWALEGDARSDDLLVRQRLAKLHEHPFDSKQWRALERAIGRDRLAKRIAREAAAAPKSVNWAILAGRAALANGDFRTAAQTFEAVEARGGKHAGKIFELRVEALERGNAWPAAIDALELRARSSRGPSEAASLLEHAHRIAEHAGLEAEALRLATEIARQRPEAIDAILRVARAAQAAGDRQAADDAYARAIARATGDLQLDLMAARARALIDTGDPAGGGEMLWNLLEKADRGRSHARDEWWRVLEQAHRRLGTGDRFAEQLESWLGDADHAREGSAWQALARARAAAGLDPVPAWRRAVAVDPRDGELRGELIQALEAEGDAAGALAEYRALPARSPAAVQMGLDMAARLLTNGEREAALALAAQIRARAGRSSDTLLLLLDFYNSHDEAALALEVARSLASTHKRDPEANIALGEQLYEMGRREEALAEWARLPKIIRPSHKGWARHAEILAAHAESDRMLRTKALASLEHALAASPRNPDYLRLRATLEEERRDYERAYESWQLARKYATDEAHQLLRDEARTRTVELLAGVSLPRKAEKRTIAVEAARKDLAGGASADARESGLFLAALYAREEKYRAAADVGRTLVELFPGDGALMMDLALAERRAGDIAGATRTLDALLEVDPSRRVDALTILSELAFESGNAEQAELAAARAASEVAGDTGALIRLGKLHERNGDVAKAKLAYRAVLEKAPGDPQARLRLADLQLTAGDLEGAAASFRSVLEAGGPGDLMQEAGQRALDLAEVTGSLEDLLALAVVRAKREPDLDEARDFLLATLDRASIHEVESWLHGGAPARDPARVASLRRPLVSALSRGPIHVRLRAAEHLGAFALPDTAVPLTRIGAQLVAPGDATNALRNAYSRARRAAIEAAAHLDDPASIPLLTAIVAEQGTGGHDDRSTRHAALWALSRSEHDAAVAPLRSQLARRDGDETTLTLACIGIADHGGDAARVADMVRADELARTTDVPTVRHACAFASAVLTPDYRVVRLHDQLRSRDPVLAAIAAWRLGQVDPAEIDPSSIRALFDLYLGPAGLPRSAASAALARLMGSKLAEPSPLPLPGEGRTSATLERWLRERIAPTFAPVSAAAFAPHRAVFEDALTAALDGTRADARAAQRSSRSCGPVERPSAADPERATGAPAPGPRCVEPLVRGTLSPAGRSVDPETSAEDSQAPRSAAKPP